MKPIYSLRFLILIALLSGFNLGAFAQTTTFNYTGGVQTFMVPLGVTVISVDMSGAQGGTGYFTGYGSPGCGGRVQCLLAVTPLTTYQIYVGGVGSNGSTSSSSNAGGYNGGGYGWYYGSGGGGASDIRTTAGVLASRLVVAGGGGGMGEEDGVGTGGAGGNLVGGNGQFAGGFSSTYAGQGGTQSTGGVGADGGISPTPGALGLGGSAYNALYGGGGGGGYYGGGGALYYGGGGGGSSYTDPVLGTAVTMTQGYNCGAGVIKINVPPPGGSCTPGALSFGPIVVGSSSPQQSVAVTAYNLSPSAGNLSVSAPAGFQVWDVPTSSWLSATTIAYTSGGVAGAPLLIRFTPTTYSIISGAVLNITGGSIITPISVSLSGQGVFPCSGTPTAGAASITPNSGGGTTNFTLSVPSASVGGGITYQWQVWSYSGGWSNIVGATTASYSFTGITSNSYYQCIVSCPTGGSATSTFTMATLSPATACTGLPTSGSVYATSANGCMPSMTTSLFNAGASSAGGIVYNWQSSPDNINWTTITGATNPIYYPTISSTTYFRDSVTCVNSLISNYSLVQMLTVNPLPGTITGATNICTPNVSFLSSTPSGGTWMSSNTAVATINLGDGEATGVTAGIANITYVLPTGCLTTTTVGVYAAPASIGGSTGVCIGSTTPLYESSTGGSWSSSNTAMATVVGSTGAVTGVAAGPVTISYTLPSGCYAVWPMTVNSLPAAITGPASVCIGQSVTMADATPGGTWYSSSFAATVGLTSGIATGLLSGVPNVVYKLPTGCSVTKALAVNNVPTAISGIASACVGSTTVLTDAGGGTWATSDPSIFTISGGTVSGVSGGVANVTYTLPVTGCYVTEPITINALPPVNTVTGGGNYCSGSSTGVHIGLNGSVTMINYTLWSSGVPVAYAEGSSTALDFGAILGAGSYTVTAKDSLTGCGDNMSGSATIGISSLPNVWSMTGGGNYCIGGSGEAVGLTNSDAGVSYQLYNGLLPVGSPVLGTGFPISLGMETATGIYTIIGTNATTLCVSNMSGTATVGTNPLPTAYNVMGGGNYCSGGTGSDVYLDNSDPSVNYTLYVGTTPVGIPMAGVSGMLDFGPQTAPGVYTVVGSDGTTSCSNNMNGSVTIGVNPLPVPFALTGGGNYCFGGSGVHIGLSNSIAGTTYKLMYLGGSVSAVPGSNAGIDFGVESGSGSYTVIATIDATGCSATMPGSASVGVNPLPSLHNVIGGGPYCAGTGGSLVQLDNSDLGITYQLYLGGMPVGPVVMGTGTGTALSFGDQTASGTYTIGAVNGLTTCALNMAGSAMVTINPTPNVYNVLPGGNYCAGGTGVDIVLSNSQTTVQYQVSMSGSAVTGWINGTGGALNLGPQLAPGVYTVIGTDISDPCSSNMSGSATINVNPLPGAYTVTGGGNYCTGGHGEHVGLALSSVGINYTMTGPGGPVVLPGTGFSLDFGLQTAVGSYTIMAYNPLSTCSNSMTGGVSINIVPLPTPYTVTGGGNFCVGGSGMPVGLSTSDSGINYQAFDGSTAVGPLVAGTWGSISFGNFSTTGTYTVKAMNATYGCMNNMASSVNIVANPLPSVFAITGGGNFCEGGTGVHVGLTNSNVGVTYYLWNGGSSAATMTGTGGAIDFGAMTAGGTYTVSATNLTTTCSNNMTGSEMVMVTPTVTPTVTISTATGATVCSGNMTTFTAVPTNGGTPSYAWMVGTRTVATTPSYSYMPANGDVVTVNMTSTANCATTNMASNAMTMTVNPKLVPSVAVTAGSGTVCPGNPVTLTATPANGGSAPNYAWKVNGSPATSSTSATYTYTPGNNDVVFCVMASNYACVTLNEVNSNDVIIKVDAPVAPVFTIAADPGTNIGKYNNVTFTVNVTTPGDAPSFAWSVNNGAVVSTGSSYSTGSLMNNDTVSCTMTSNSTCGQLSTKEYLVMNVNDLAVKNVGNIADLNVMPNPNKGTFTVKGTLGNTVNEEVTLEVVNMLGQVVYTTKVSAQNGAINEQVQLNNSLSNGMYLLNVHTSTGNSVFHFEIQQ